MIDHKSALVNLKPGQSHVIPDRDRARVQPDWQIPETRAQRVREGDADAIYEDSKFIPAIRHVYVAPHPPEPPPPPPPATLEKPEYDADYAAMVARAEIVNDVLDVIRS